MATGWRGSLQVPIPARLSELVQCKTRPLTLLLGIRAHTKKLLTLARDTSLSGFPSAKEDDLRCNTGIRAVLSVRLTVKMRD